MRSKRQSNQHDAVHLRRLRQLFGRQNDRCEETVRNSKPLHRQLLEVLGLSLWIRSSRTPILCLV